MKAILYCRVAHNDMLTLDWQKARLKAYAKEHGFQIERTVAECSTGIDYNRKGLQEVAEIAASGKVNVLLIWNLTRLGRDTFKTAEYLRWLKEQNVEAICADGTVPQPHIEYLHCLIEAMKTQMVKGEHHR